MADEIARLDHGQGGRAAADFQRYALVSCLVHGLSAENGEARGLRAAL